ncbi:RNA polymerase sigma factor [Paenibacillus sp. IB182496]|uniref:RNA polymerase sigma factor n=1 Tax=Paenibacillus sabuli TaxID=2772509 RepID=A0A927BT77_9BACL|nr:RNA polymerase sigma factor [Paenibacillus sabuli]MBD2845079.1 RNA polymerase sigma factor [Paenibacillus sabuli]
MSDPLFGLFRSNIRHLDEATQRRLFFAFRKLVYPGLVFLLGDHALAEDAVQEAFIKAMQRGPAMKHDTHIKAWLKQVARNAAIDLMRKNKKYRPILDPDSVIDNEEKPSLALPATSVEEVVEQMIRNERLVEALQELKHEHRVALYLRYMEGLSIREIASLLHIRESASGKRLERAKARLAELFVRKWGDSR